jgi:serine/threonine protein kinase
LSKAIQSQKVTDPEIKLKILFGLAEGLRFLHDQGFRHGRVSCNNVLLDANLNPYLSDFGLGLIRESNAVAYRKDSGLDRDLFAFGLVCYSVLTGNLPNFHVLPAVTEVPGPFQALLSACWNQGKEISFDAIVTSFLRRDLVLPVDDFVKLRLRDYQARVVCPSFLARSIVTALNNLTILRTEGDQLNTELGDLRRSFAKAAALVTSCHKRSPGNPAHVSFSESEAKCSLPKKHAISGSASAFQLIPMGLSPFTPSDKKRSPSPEPEPEPAPADSAVADLERRALAFSSIQPIGKQVSARDIPIVMLPGAPVPMEGIFARLAREHGGNINVAKEGLVTITGNSLESARDADLMEIVTPGWTRCWTSQNEPDSWILFDFGNRQVSVTSYLIQTYPCVKDYSHLRSWTLEGCAEHSSKWTQLDSRQNNHDLNGRSRSAVFTCQANPYCNIVRLRQTGKNHHNDYFLVVSSVEFFGELLG